MVMLFQIEHAGHFQSENVVVGASVREHNACVRYRPPTLARFFEQRHRVFDGVRNVSAAKNSRVGKAVDQVDDQQAYRSLQFQTRAKTLARIGLYVVATHFTPPSSTLPLRTTSSPSSITVQLRKGISMWPAVVRTPPPSLLGPNENRKLPSNARASMAMVCSLSYRPMVVQEQRGCRPRPMCEMA